MIRILTALLAATSLASAPGFAQDPAAEALEGAWVVSVGEDTRDRFLIVEGARTDKNLVLVAKATYGWIDGTATPVKEWKAEIAGDTITLSFLTPAASKISVTFKSTDTSVSGDFVSKAGKKYDVRMTRLDAEELAAMRGAAKAQRASAAGGKVGAAANSKISLVYVGADDCPSCVRFINRVGKDGRNLKDIAPELAETRFVYVHLWAFRDSVGAGSLPPDMAWLVQPAANGKAPLRKRGTPFFAAVVDQRVVAQGHGVTALETLVAPSIKRAVEEKRAAN